MAPSRNRSPSPVASSKRLKPNPPTEDPKLVSRFAKDLLTDANAMKLKRFYQESHPFKYCVLDRLFEDNLLRNAKDECVGELCFTEKATDIYRVYQTGDLASLSYLPDEQLNSLPSLLTLRDTLYSANFRQFIRTVTGCGPLSGSKQDMSVNSYKTGCHLLNHDDVIGSRCVSYILYMPLPVDERWDEAWGGSLELYPVNEDGEPQTAPSKKIPPAWNQFVFFEVQPGRSFHSVEEVVVPGNDSRDRLSISGWFHTAQEGEEGYQPEPDSRDKSSLEQLSVAPHRPLTPYASDEEPPLPSSILTEAHISFLSDYLDPVYLSPKNLPVLAERFASESSLQMHSFLRESIATKLETGLRGLDAADLLGPTRTLRLPAYTSGAITGWSIKGPPHKQRYGILTDEDPELAPPDTAKTSVVSILRSLQDDLFPSPAFRAWLALVTSLLPLQYAIEARRFRPGLDYTLATSEEDDTRLDVVLGLTPDMEVEGKGKGKEEANWEGGEWGGWECYMAAREEDDDPAIYGSGARRKAQHISSGDEESANAQETDENSDQDEEEEDSTLLTVQPGFNRLLLVLRDPGVLHFVKYVSAKAPGSRWDICGEWEVGQVEEEEEDGDAEGNGEEEVIDDREDEDA
ncbi:Oxoglutarate and iron-dependent oxygenase degradation C-term-domain-containing protein [Gautieria morchelliformis]|nr:Oxoglutarate and iron-dependent oxygenase degradation C-term-domain-containing protein [Gautieria morchelliformis]